MLFLIIHKDMRKLVTTKRPPTKTKLLTDSEKEIILNRSVK